MKKRTWLTGLLCLVMSVAAMLFAAGCSDTPATDTGGSPSTPSLPQTCTVTIVFDDTTVQTTVASGSILPVTAPQKTGMAFAGFYENGEKITLPYTVQSDVTLTAQWGYTVTVQDGESETTQVVAENETLTLDDAAKNGAVFMGYYADNKQVSFPLTVTQNVTLTPKWGYTVTVDNNGTVSEKVYAEGAKVYSLYKSGYTFLGYSDGVNNLGTTLTVQSNLTLTALWQETKCNVTVHNGNETTTTVYSYGEKLTLPTLAAKDGMDFIGYYNNKTKVSFPYSLSRDVELTAKWGYTLTFINDDTTDCFTETVLPDTSYTPKTPTRIGYKFKGFFAQDGNTPVSFPVTVNAHTTYTVQWEKSDFETALKSALKTYLQSDAFQKSVQSATTSQARVPLLYLRYVNGNFYNTDTVIQFKKYLNYINDLVDGGEIVDYKYSASSITSWYGITDYLYTWSLIYNQYMQWCKEEDKTDTSLQIYIPMIERYLKKIDDFLALPNTEYSEFGTNKANLYSTGYNDFNNFSQSRYEAHPAEWYEKLLNDIIKDVTNSTKGHDAFLKELKTVPQKIADGWTSSQLRTYGQNTLLPLWRNLLPITQVSFGYATTNVLPLIAANLGIEGATPYSDKMMISYYEKNADGTFKKDSTGCNWVGFSGRPIAGSLYRNKTIEGITYDVNYEKTMQAYFPFEDKGMSQQGIDKMVNIDRLCNYYDHTLSTGSNVSPQYALMTAMMHGIDMNNYTKAAPDTDTYGERDRQPYNVIEMWFNSLTRDADYNFVIGNYTDMAVAIAYLAQQANVEAPTPFGVFNNNTAVITL
ncbi:MAG: InlB B-repeat-containing protein [Clostridiales bacterium]|nr:InlB B-repeat-containing protein [Clostridiales bacterium]